MTLEDNLDTIKLCNNLKVQLKDIFARIWVETLDLDHYSDLERKDVSHIISQTIVEIEKYANNIISFEKGDIFS